MPYNTFDPDASASESGAANNSLDGLNVGEGCPSGNVNAAIRRLMAEIRKLFNAVPDAALLMPKVGGVFTGEVSRQGAGGYMYNSNALSIGGKVTIAPVGSALPVTPAEGDWFLEY
jgi:hypothetical protein